MRVAILRIRSFGSLGRVSLFFFFFGGGGGGGGGRGGLRTSRVLTPGDILDLGLAATIGGLNSLNRALGVIMVSLQRDPKGKLFAIMPTPNPKP